jgi:hypothetical protein
VDNAPIPTDVRDIFFIPLALWFAAVLIHLMATVFESGVADKSLAAQAAIQMSEPPLSWEAEKAKRDDTEYVTINEEGEIVPHDEQDQTDQSSPNAS